MKKIIACISLVFAMSAGVTALAAEDPSFVNEETKNAITVGDASAYETVLIEKDADILYVDQVDTGLSAASNFLIKAPEAEVGTYTVKMYGIDGTTYSKELKVRNIVDPVVTSLDVKNRVENEEASTFDIGCFASGIEAGKCNFIVLTITKGSDSTVAYLEPDVTMEGEGDVNVAVKITNIPDAYTVAVGVSDIAPEEE